MRGITKGKETNNEEETNVVGLKKAPTTKVGGNRRISNMGTSNSHERGKRNSVMLPGSGAQKSGRRKGAFVVTEEESEDLVPALPILNNEQAKLLIAALSESKKGGRGSVSTASGFGFVRRQSIANSGVEETKEKNADEREQPIPTGMQRYPADDSLIDQYDVSVSRRTSQVTREDMKVPNGFLISCPFQGFDPDKLDRNAIGTSVIYSKVNGPAELETNEYLEGLLKGKPSLSSRIVSKKVECPEGYTYDRNPVLFPNKNQ
jgi:hypothetical protein